MDKFHNKKLPHLIYAILWEDDGDEFAFVGKTTTVDTKALLRRHLRGEVSVTAQYLKRDDWEGKPPQLIVLQSLSCTGAEAYRYILCYHRLYEDFGFMTVAYRGTDNQAYDMLPFTGSIYEELQKTVTRDFLRTGIIAEKMIVQHVSRAKKEPTTQLNIRVDMYALCVFRRYCSKLGITQKEGFLHLMHCVDQDSLAIDPLFVEQRNTIERQKRHIDELEAKLQKESRGQKADAKLKEAMVETKRLVSQYIAQVVAVPTGSPLKISSHKAQAECKDFLYPDCDGSTVLQLRRLHYGRGSYAAVFLCGIDLHSGASIKLRYYPKKTYIGSVPGGKYCVENARWVVYYRRATDGAMELTAALPLPLDWEQGEPEKTKKSEEQKWLDELIQEANMQRWQ